MKTSSSAAIAAASLLLVGLGVWMYFGSKPERVTSFDECVKAGYPVMESFPEQCRTPDGRTFVRELELPFSDLIQVDQPVANAIVTSPLVVSGKARGNWYFEASFPVTLLDANDKVLVQVPAQAQGEWMTTDFVPFRVTLTFAQPTTQMGTLIVQNDNPSGLPENDKKVRIPVRFGTAQSAVKTEFGKAFTLQMNGSVELSDGLMVTLIEINDSRCKPDVQCVWQGELSPNLQATGGQLKETEQIRLGTVTQKTLAEGGYTFTLQSATDTTVSLTVTRSGP
jgi:hypothetical protein